jgi:para-nitrobenzyl esterase
MNTSQSQNGPTRSRRNIPPRLLGAAAVLFATGALPGCVGSGGDPTNPPGPGDGGNADGGSLTVMLADGPVRGDIVGGTRRFLKIPYAKPPVGDLRWKAPVKNDPWSTVRHETAFSVPCAQNMNSQEATSTNEDCLYLNVWAPDPAPSKAPVMVWFHGGGNFAGATSDKVPTTSQLWYDGQFFAARHGAVVVTANYRLGPMGFFPHPALAAEHSPLGNQGLLDQRMVLTWVQSHISAFGGDMGNVTIFGESAGSADVCYHVASPGDAGLFHRAISESGGCTTSINGGKDATAATAAAGMTAFTTAMGCDAAQDQLACLRGKSPAEILANAMQPNPMSGQVTTSQWTFGVVVDGPGGFLPDQARTLYDQGQIAHVPYILGSNNDEGTLFLFGAPSLVSASDYMSALTQRFGTFAAQVATEYPVSNFNGDYNAALARVVGDSGLVCGTHDTARRAAKAGLHVYMYNFNIPWAINPTVFKASHASEISHVFGDPVKPTPADQIVSDAMNAYWWRFASAGDPNGAGAPAVWPPFQPDASDNDERLQLDSGWEILNDFRKAECAFWRQYYDQNFAAP